MRGRHCVYIIKVFIWEKERMSMNKKTNNKGFSLVELIIVIAIMAILIGVLAPQFLKFVEKSRESTDLQNVEEIKTAVETYVADHSDASLPATITVNCPSGSIGNITCSGVTLTDYGVASTGIPNKSTKWEGTFTWTYNTSGSKAYQWDAPAASVHATYFKADGSNYP